MYFLLQKVVSGGELFDLQNMSLDTTGLQRMSQKTVANSFQKHTATTVAHRTEIYKTMIFFFFKEERFIACIVSWLSCCLH